MLLTRDKSQLLIVDVQDKLLGAISGKDRVVDRCIRLVRAARALDVPITVSEQYPQGLGPTVDSIRDALANAAFVADKVEFSCLRSDAAARAPARAPPRGQGSGGAGRYRDPCLRSANGDRSRGAGFRGLRGGRRRGLALQGQPQACAARLAKAGVDVVDSEMVLFEWLERAGTPAFKELQALIK